MPNSFIKMTGQDNIPLVSIAIPVYNHVRFISKALDSVLMQKTSFAYEIIIGDDCSTDGTRIILKQYQEKYPEKIRLLLQEKNTGVLNNSLHIYKHCKAKYIALIEGDDYWIYEYKLQKQVDFLEQNKEYNACFHDAEIITCNDQAETAEHAKKQFYSEYKYYSQFNNYRSDFHPWDMLQRQIIPNASFVFRNNDYFSFFRDYSDIALSVNWAIMLNIIKNSKFRYFNEAWSAYTDHAEGVSKKVKSIVFNQTNIKILKKLFKDSYYHSIRLNVQKAILNEYRLILYNQATYDESIWFLLKNHCFYSGWNFRLFVSETFYFFRRKIL